MQNRQITLEPQYFDAILTMGNAIRELSMSTINVPIDTGLFIELVDFLRENGSDRDPVDTVSLAINYWIDNASWKKEDLMPEIFDVEKGYLWKELFLPHGTAVRMRYKNQYYYAVIKGDEFIYDNESISPSLFANKVTASSRNAWRDLELKRPKDRHWMPAERLRKEAKSNRVDLDKIFGDVDEK